AQHFHEVADEPFGATIDRPVRIRLETGDRGGGDDMAGFLGNETGQYGRKPVQHALDVDIDHPVPVVGFHGRQRRIGHKARIEENDVDAAESLLGELHYGVVVGLPGHVQHLPGDLSAIFLDLRGDLFELVLAAGAENDFRALGGEELGGGLADA